MSESDHGPGGLADGDTGAASNDAVADNDVQDTQGDLPPGTAALLNKWRERSPSDQTMPEEEARLVVEAVLDNMRGATPDRLEIAGRAWGRAHRSVLEMVERLSRLRAALASLASYDPDAMHAALDRVTAAATEEVMARLEHVSRTDALTGVGNRRAFDETIQGTLSAAHRQGHEVTVVAVDLDGLKRINDTKGHAAGDAALIALVRAFFDALRDEDLIFRLGGDEFVIVLPFTSVGAAEALMRRVAATTAPSFTWGAAGYPRDGSDPAALVDAADLDLYQRRGMRVVPVPVPRRLPLVPPKLESASRIGRLAWIPAAAVLVVSLILTLVSTGSPVSSFAGRHPHTTPTTTVTTTPNGGGGPTTTVAPSTASRGGSGVPISSRGSSGQGALTGYTSTPTTSSTGSSGPSTSGGGGGGGNPPPPSGSTGTGGLLGTLNNLLAPVPLVGGNSGLLSIVDQLLIGQPSTAASVSAASAAPVSSNGLLAMLGGL